MTPARFRPFLCIGHRGAKGHAPENTLLSIQCALGMGADWVEVDVRAAGGELVVIHDESLDRTTNGTGLVADRDLAYLRSLDAGEGQRIPLLREVLDLVRGRAGLNADMKGAGWAAPMARLLDERGSRAALDASGLLVSSFDHSQLKELRALVPGVPLGAIVDRPPDGTARFAEELGAAVAVVGLAAVTEGLVEDAHGRSIAVYVFTVNEASAVRRVRGLGADGVFTDYPDRVRAIVAEAR